MLSISFYLVGLVAIAATTMVIVSRNAVHALLHLVVSLLAAAVIFFQLGAPFAAALEVIVYAGAIMVLMVFVIMMLNQGDAATTQESEWLRPRTWLLPCCLSAALLVLLAPSLIAGSSSGAGNAHTTLSYISARDVGIALFSGYLLAVELASMLLLAGLVGAFHLARRHSTVQEEE